MLRRSLVALMMGVICAGSAVAEESAARRPNPSPTGLMGWLNQKTSGTRTAGAPARPMAKSSKTPQMSTAPARAGIERAVVQDAERQAIVVRQTAGRPDDRFPEEPLMQAAEAPLQPVPIQQVPEIPNLSTVTGPQYFSALPAGMSNPIPVHPSNNWQTYQAPMPIQQVSQGQYWNVSNPNSPAGPAYVGSAPMSFQNGSYPQNGGGYPQTGAALYPAPQPGIPQYIGGIAIENQAFHPHEMLYAHQYKAMYPPYYYKVNGGWMVTPFGVWSHEDWKLQGTQVDVKYKSHISPFTLFKPPLVR